MRPWCSVTKDRESSKPSGSTSETSGLAITSSVTGSPPCRRCEASPGRGKAWLCSNTKAVANTLPDGSTPLSDDNGDLCSRSWVSERSRSSPSTGSCRGPRGQEVAVRRRCTRRMRGDHRGRRGVHTAQVEPGESRGRDRLRGSVRPSCSAWAWSAQTRASRSTGPTIDWLWLANSAHPTRCAATIRCSPTKCSRSPAARTTRSRRSERGARSRCCGNLRAGGQAVLVGMTALGKRVRSIRSTSPTRESRSSDATTDPASPASSSRSAALTLTRAPELDRLVGNDGTSTTCTAPSTTSGRRTAHRTHTVDPNFRCSGPPRRND